MDYNEDRQINFYRSSEIRSVISTAQSNKNRDANIYLNTLGNDTQILIKALFIVVKF